MTARLAEPAPRELRPSRFSHLVLKTAQFERMTAWYKTVLAAAPMFENPVVSFLSYDEWLRIGTIAEKHMAARNAEEDKAGEADCVA